MVIATLVATLTTLMVTGSDVELLLAESVAIAVSV